MDGNLCADREHLGAVPQPVVFICTDFHFIMNAFKDQMRDNTVNASFTRFAKADIFRTDHDIDRFVLPESFVHAGKRNTEYFYQTVF